MFYNTLRGTKPVDMPVQQPTKFDLVILRPPRRSTPNRLLALADASKPSRLTDLTSSCIAAPPSALPGFGKSVRGSGEVGTLGAPAKYSALACDSPECVPCTHLHIAFSSAGNAHTRRASSTGSACR